MFCARYMPQFSFNIIESFQSDYSHIQVVPLPFWTNLFDQFYDPCSITTYMAPWEGTFNLKTFLPSNNISEKIKMLLWVVTSLYICLNGTARVILNMFCPFTFDRL